MKLRLSCFAASILLAWPAAAATAAKAAAPAPRLVLLIAVDQLRYDYLTRFETTFDAGLKQLLDGGAVFTNAHLDHYPSVTAVGHSAMLTGAWPSVSGIVGNDWYERSEARNITSVEDVGVRLVGEPEAPERKASSPHRLRVSTIGDELKLAGRDSRVIGIAIKDRSAILMAGRMADAAYWFSSAAPGFVTSTWYRDALPAWAVEFGKRGSLDAWLGRQWRALGSAGRPGPLLGTLPGTPGAQYYGALLASPFGNDLTVEFALAALAGERLGAREATDLLAVSFSCNDSVGHNKGPHSAEVEDVTRRTDLAIARLLAAVDRQVGLSRTLVVLTADHGVAPVPEQMQTRKMPAGRLGRDELVTAATAAMEAAYGKGDWVSGRAGASLYLNRERIAERGLDAAAVERVAAAGLERLPAVWRTYTRSQLLEGRVSPDPWGRRVMRGFDRERSGDVEAVLEPYWMPEGIGTTHGSPWSYDTHIPLVLMGPGIRPGRQDSSVVLNDLAPTLATLLRIETPSGSSGRVLVEALAAR
jgi:hypothetical protein